MAVTIHCKQWNDGLCAVNGKPVRRDMDGDWIAQEELTTIEAEFFHQYRLTKDRFPNNKLQITYEL